MTKNEKHHFVHQRELRPDTYRSKSSSKRNLQQTHHIVSYFTSLVFVTVRNCHWMNGKLTEW